MTTLISTLPAAPGWQPAAGVNTNTPVVGAGPGELRSVAAKTYSPETTQVLVCALTGSTVAAMAVAARKTMVRGMRTDEAWASMTG